MSISVKDVLDALNKKGITNLEQLIEAKKETNNGLLKADKWLVHREFVLNEH